MRYFLHFIFVSFLPPAQTIQYNQLLHYWRTKKRMGKMCMCHRIADSFVAGEWIIYFKLYCRRPAHQCSLLNHHLKSKYFAWSVKQEFFFFLFGLRESENFSDASLSARCARVSYAAAKFTSKQAPSSAVLQTLVDSNCVCLDSTSPHRDCLSSNFLLFEVDEDAQKKNNNENKEYSVKCNVQLCSIVCVWQRCSIFNCLRYWNLLRTCRIWIFSCT